MLQCPGGFCVMGGSGWRRRGGRQPAAGLHPPVQQRLRRTGVDGLGGTRETVRQRRAQVVRAAYARVGRQCRRRVQQHDVAHRPGIAAEHGPESGCVVRGVTAAQVLRPGPGEAERRGIELRLHHRRAVHDPDRRRRGGRQLIEAVVAVEDHRAASAVRQHARDHPAHPPVRHANRLRLRPRRVRHRAEEVEHGRHAELAPRRGGMTQGRMVKRREEKRRPDLLRKFGARPRREVDHHTERFQHVGGAALRGCRPVTVLDHPGARRRRHDRCHRRDVDRVRAVSPGPHQVHQAPGHMDRCGMVKHRLRESGHLGGRFPLGAQRDSETRYLDAGRRPLHDLVHRPRRLAGGERLPPDQGAEYRRPAIPRVHGCSRAAGSSGAGDLGTPGAGPGAAGPLPHQAREFPGELLRVDRVADHGVGPRPGRQPSVVGAPRDQQDRRAVVDLVLGLAAHAHSPGWLGLAVEHHDLHAAGVEQLQQRGLRRALDDLGLGSPGLGARADGKPDLSPYVGIVAVHNDLHGKEWYRPAGRPPPPPASARGCRRPWTHRHGGSGADPLRGVVIMTLVATTAPATQAVPRTPANRPNLVSVGTIIWLSSELMFFAALFAMYFTIRSVDKGQGLPWPGAHLDIPLATANTTVLLLSSVTCQLGVFAVERGQVRRAASIWNVGKWGLREWYVLTFLMGAYFDAGQGYEYTDMIVHQHVTLSSSAYGSVFYIPTGFHGLHVAGGLVAFLFLLGRTFAAKRFTREQQISAIVVSYYWHFVDVVWIALFTTIYLIH